MTNTAPAPEADVHDEKKDSGPAFDSKDPGSSPVYDIPHGLHRTDFRSHTNTTTHSNELESLEYSSAVDSETYTALAESSVTGHAAAHFHASHTDATEIVHETHLALLYLLSNPEEFQKALAAAPSGFSTTLAQWNVEYDSESMGESVDTNGNNQNHFDGGLVGAIFASDSEVVLPQAHTASQLFGLERRDGIELEAACGIPSLSQLFLRWLALMPGGDHLNIIDPPGLTVMRIAGGRYRVTAAHRVVWTWMNEFASLHEDIEEEVDRLQIGDLVTMTIVDVFETDNQGKLLSYCPTFDNRAIHKTMQSAETLRKSRTKLLKVLSDAQNSKLAKLVLEKATVVGNLVKQRMVDATSGYSSPSRKRSDSGGPAFSDVASTINQEQSMEMYEA